jgi:SP family arabinose:H+ symporter-like MFS transporter
MNAIRSIRWSLVVSLGGFLFGFDTAVISGAERAIQQLWKLDPYAHGLTVSIALIGTVFGALLGGIPSDRLGRKPTLLLIALLYLVSALGSALTWDWHLFLIFRFLGGLGVGSSSVTAPMYISEISPAAVRGQRVALFQFNIVFGILMAYLSNYLLENAGDEAWRWMLGVQAFPSLLFLLALLNVPESPRWLVVKKGETAKALRVLEQIDPQTAQSDLEAIEGSMGHATEAKTVFFSKAYFRPILLAFLFAFFNQVSGINAIIYYAPRIFENAGLGKSAALLSSTGIGFVNLISTLVGLRLIDRYGRRSLMLVGSFGLIATLLLVAFAFYQGPTQAALVPFYLFAYIAFFAFSQGAVIWVFISEIFPNQVRAGGITLGSFTHWFMAALIAFVFPILAGNEPVRIGNTFLVFCLMMVLQLLFVWRMMPETKGTSLEQIDRVIAAH